MLVYYDDSPDCRREKPDPDKERRQGFIAYGVLLVVSAIIGYGLLVSIAGAWR